MSSAPPAIPPDLPGADLVGTGLEDLRGGKVTVPALYLLLEDTDPAGAHARYNALRQRLVSFCITFEQLARRRHS